MNLTFHIAWRYFRVKKSVQAINIIAWISIGAIAVASAAMIILFSVFNGLDNTIKEAYTSFNPELKVTPKKGKFFSLKNGQLTKLENLPGISLCSETIEDMVLLSNENEQMAAEVKGVNNDWFQVTNLKKYMFAGSADWPESHSYIPGIIGLGIANNLGINVNNPFSELRIFYPKPNLKTNLNPEQSLSQIVVKPKGLFRIQQEFDNKYILIPLSVAQHLFNQEGKLSSIEISVTNFDNINKIQKSVVEIMGSEFKVANRFEQNQTLFMVLSGEKWIIYLILLFVLLLASFNLTGSLYMLVLEKKKDITILKLMGLGKKAVRKLFLTEAVLLALAGAVMGICLGALICLGQMYFGWIKLPDGFLITAYPVSFEWTDFILVFGTVIPIGWLAGWYPAFKAGRQPAYLREE